MDRLAEFGRDGHDASSRPFVRLLPWRVKLCQLQRKRSRHQEEDAPLVVVDTRGIDDELLDALARVGLLGDHDPRREEEAIERHALNAVELLAPLAREVRVRVRRVVGTKAGAGDEDDVGPGPDGRVRREDRGVEVFATVVASGAATGPLQDDGKVGVRAGDVDDLTDAVDGSCAKRKHLG